MKFLLPTKAKLMNSNGFATLEILIAMALMVSVISSVLPLVAGEQGNLVDAQLQQEALQKAQDLLAQNQVSVFSDSESQCGQDVKSSATWQATTIKGKEELVSRTSNVSRALALGGDCQAQVFSGDASVPNIFGNIDFGNGQVTTGIDVVGTTVFISTQSSVVTDPDFFIVDVADQKNPVVISSLDTGPGLLGLDVVYDFETGHLFAYAGNNKTSQQLVVIDVDALHHFANPVVVAFADLQPSPLGSNSQPASIFYYDKKVYIGIHYMPSPSATKPEFHILNVLNPQAPFEVGSFNVNHNINQIIVDGQFAYLATSDDAGEVWVLDVSRPSQPLFVSKFDAPGDEDGESIYLLNHTLYLGRDHAPQTRSDFYVLDVTDPLHIAILGSKNVALSPATAKVSGIRASGRYVFLATSDTKKEFLVLDVSDTAHIPNPLTTQDLLGEASGIDLENNIIFISLKNSNGLKILSYESEKK